MMFRGCYFKFAGKSSELYNLILIYKDNENDNFNSGGEFNLRTDSVIGAHSQLLYGKDYSETPLEFVVEIVTPEGNIPMERMISIKNWLYGQDGWRDLTIIDDTQKYHLKCVLIPMEDITDVHGYRGVRCTIHNASPFWYGNTKEITIDYAKLTSGYNPPSQWFGWNNFRVDIPNNNFVDCDIYPEIIIKTNRSKDYPFGYGNVFMLSNTDVDTLEDGFAKTTDQKNYLHEETSRISFDNTYLENTLEECNYRYYHDETNQKYLVYIQNSSGQISLEIDTETEPTDDKIKNTIIAAGYHSLTYDSETKTGTAVYAKDIVHANTEYVHIQSEQCPDYIINPTINLNLPKPVFKLHYGTNICRIYYGYAYESITFRYTPLLRMGAF